MNNEQDMILREKIEKREKFDTILAYILIVILLGCIAIVLVLKFNNNDEDDVVQEEYTPKYISLDDINSRLNSSDLVKRYSNDGVRFSCSVSGNSIVIDYVKDDTDIDVNIPMVGNELMFTIDEDNNEIITDIYKEIGSIICVYYGNEDKHCKNTIDNISDTGNDSIRIVNDNIYIDTTKSYTVNNEIVYNDVTKVKLDDNDYVLNMLDIKVYNINVNTGDNSVVFNGNVDRLGDDTSNVSVLVKLYDKDSNLLGENKYEYNEENVLENTGIFEVEFLVSDTLKLEDINTYSIEIVK